MTRQEQLSQAGAAQWEVCALGRHAFAQRGQGASLSSGWEEDKHPLLAASCLVFHVKGDGWKPMASALGSGKQFLLLPSDRWDGVTLKELREGRKASTALENTTIVPTFFIGFGSWIVHAGVMSCRGTTQPARPNLTRQGLASGTFPVTQEPRCSVDRLALRQSGTIVCFFHFTAVSGTLLLSVSSKSSITVNFTAF